MRRNRAKNTVRGPGPTRASTRSGPGTGRRLRWSAAFAVFFAGCDGIVSPPVPASLTVVSGHGQEAKAGERGPHPFVVRVADESGRGVPGVLVRWTLTSGDGRFEGDPLLRTGFADLATSTYADGLAHAWFVPTAAGESSVTARIQGSGDTGHASVSFTVDAKTVVIHAMASWDGWPCEGMCFVDPAGTSRTALPLGTAIEWVNRSGVDGFLIRSSRAPSGANTFEARLAPDERFRFVPDQIGTWHYETPTDRATGVLTVVRPSEWSAAR